MANKKQKTMCGLWHANVAESDYNNNGKCECIGCFGTHCHNCRKYRELTEQLYDMFGKSVCQLCMAHQQNTK